MNHLLNLLGKDSVKVAYLDRIYAAEGARESFVSDAISVLGQLDADVAWRAVWLLKRAARDRRLTEGDLIQLAKCAEGLPHWAARLNLCQLFGTTGCPEAAREVLYPYLVECFSNRRPMIRAWAISVLADFRGDADYSRPIAAMIRQARADPAGSIQARLRAIDSTRRIVGRRRPTPD